MKTDTFRLELLLATFGSWVNREQTQVIDYLREENRILRRELSSPSYLQQFLEGR